MTLKAVLTVGWHDDVAAPESASRLFAQTLANGEDPTAGLGEALAGRSPVVVHGLDRLFRLRVGGFRRVQAMASALIAYATSAAEDVFCHVDAFSYAFLRAAKNFDLLLPEARTHPDAAAPTRPLRQVLPGWTEEIARLREFERAGATIPGDKREAYLALRRIVARPTARDEVRALAVLLVSGPSTASEISEDLGLSYGLGGRVFQALAEAGAVTRDGDVWSVAEASLPRVLFCLTATLGIDYLAMLEPDS